MARPWKADEQWVECGICGFYWPLSELTVQQTEVSSRSKRCPRCYDNTENQYPEKKTAEYLRAVTPQESRDHRNDPEMWFQHADLEA